MHEPVFRVAGHFGGAHQFVGGSAQVVPPGDVPQRPLAGVVVGDGNQKLRAGIFLFGLASDVAEGVDCQVLVQMGLEVNGGRLASGRLQSPDLFLLQGGSVGVDFETESFGGQVFELDVDQSNSPASLRHGVVVQQFTVFTVLMMTVQSVHTVHCVDLQPVVT